MNAITIKTSKKNELIDITGIIREIVSQSGVREGICFVYVPHTTAALLINENADPNIKEDFLMTINKIITEHDNYKHDMVDNNAAAHIKASLIGPSQLMPIHKGDLFLGVWQSVFLCEFDGPRNRKIYIKIIKENI
ncbi:MAG: secondary thiamine-phosphate synthase enzyme YjbQ [Candidatus Woesearchaeota archaeon]